MPDGINVLVMGLGFGFVLVAGSWLADGTPGVLLGLFPSQGGRDWPTGVQEADAPRFAVAHLDGLRTGGPDLVELFDRPLGSAGGGGLAFGGPPKVFGASHLAAAVVLRQRPLA